MIKKVIALKQSELLPSKPKKEWLVLSIILTGLVILILASCTSFSIPVAEEAGLSSARPVTLMVWSDEADLMQNDPHGNGRYGIYLKEQFEKEHPGVTVIIENHGWDEELRHELGQAIAAGTAPDIVVGENYFQPYAARGDLLILDDKIAAIKHDLITGTYKSAMHNGHIYGVSTSTGVFSFEQNCDVVKAAGLKCDNPPQTWEDLLAQTKEIAKQGQGDYYGYTLQGMVGFSVGGIFRVAVYLAQADAPLCKNNCTYPWFDNPKAIPVMEFLRELHKNTPPGLIYNPDEDYVYTQLFEGRSAYQIAGSWHVKWAKEAGCKDCRYFSVPIPKDGAEANIIVGNVIYAVLNDSKQPDLAVEWVKFLLRDDVQALINPTVGRLPSTRSGLEQLRLAPETDEATKTYIDQLLHNPHLEILPQWSKHSFHIWNIYNEMLTRVLLTDEPIKKIMAEAQAAADEEMQR